jgi:hypothetical protein
MDTEVLKLLKQLLQEQNNIKIRLDKIEKRLGTINNQTVDLAKFRAEINLRLDAIHDENTVESIASDNWNEIEI